MGRVPRNVGDEFRRSATPPCTKLKQFRTHAGITALVAAKACGLSSPNSFYRYESVDRMGDTSIPDHIIEAIMPLILGRGAPPVTKDDLISISSAHRLLSSQKIQAPHSTPQSEPNSLMLETENAMLKKLYREAMLEIATLRDAKNRVQ